MWVQVRMRSVIGFAFTVESRKSIENLQAF
jgi:hypothetical protein